MRKGHRMYVSKGRFLRKSYSKVSNSENKIRVLFVSFGLRKQPGSPYVGPSDTCTIRIFHSVLKYRNKNNWNEYKILKLWGTTEHIVSKWSMRILHMVSYWLVNELSSTIIYKILIKHCVVFLTACLSIPNSHFSNRPPKPFSIKISIYSYNRGWL